MTVTYDSSTRRYTITNSAAIINVTNASASVNVTGDGTNTVVLTPLGGVDVIFQFDDASAGNTYTLQDTTAAADRFTISNTSGVAGSDTINLVSTLATSRIHSSTPQVCPSPAGSPLTTGYTGATTAALTIQAGSGTDQFNLNSAPTGITSITIEGGGGDDSVNASTAPAGVTVTFDGEAGDNSVRFGNGSLSGIAQIPTYTSTGGTTGLTIDWVNRGDAEEHRRDQHGGDRAGVDPDSVHFGTPCEHPFAGRQRRQYVRRQLHRGRDDALESDLRRRQRHVHAGQRRQPRGRYRRWRRDEHPGLFSLDDRYRVFQFTSTAAAATGVSFALNIQVVNGGSGNDLFLLVPGTFTANGNAGL